MAITKDWEVNTCIRDLSDGYITKVIYRITVIEDGVEIKEAKRSGSVEFTKPSSLPSDFISYDMSAKKPDAATVLSWVKTKIDADAAEDNGSTVAQIETAIDNHVNEIKTPVTATGVPW
tara:strand:- start:617 stop:973 length:357 start_codon:yes stop_codon:yes gene_type:complete